MIPIWLLTTLHYASLAAGVAILLLLAWRPFGTGAKTDDRIEG